MALNLTTDKIRDSQPLLATPGPVLRDLAPGANSTYWDFMIGDVCLDARGNRTSGDPATCTTRRNLRIGESLPYLQHIVSFPIRGPNGRTLVGVWQDTFKKNLGKGIHFSLREYIASSESGDALETLSLESPGSSLDRSSIVYTQVAPGGATYWADGSGAFQCGTYNGWFLIPYNLTFGGPGQFNRYSYRPKPAGGICAATPTSGLSVGDWWTAPFDFGNGIPLETITTRDWDTASPPNGNESYFWTRQYGYTRHEAWTNVANCGSRSPICTDAGNPTNPANPLAEAPCTGEYKVNAWGVWYWRKACENAWFDGRPADPELHPFVLPLPDTLREDNNLLVNGDWAGLVTTPWEKTANTNWAWKLVAINNNNRVQFSCNGTCSGNTIFNPLPARLGIDPGGSLAKFQDQGIRTLQAGAVLKADAGATGTMSVAMYDSSKALVATYQREVTHDGSDHLVEMHFNANFSGPGQPRWFSFQYSPKTTGAHYELDEAYVVGFQK
jgi:hypothetical protein